MASFLKFGLGTPIYKHNDPLDMDRYRQITVSNVLTKIFDKTMYHRMTKYLDKCQVISKTQNGFYPSRSVKIAVYEFVENIYKNLENKIIIGALFFDLTRASG